MEQIPGKHHPEIRSLVYLISRPWNSQIELFVVFFLTIEGQLYELCTIYTMLRFALIGIVALR